MNGLNSGYRLNAHKLNWHRNTNIPTLQFLKVSKKISFLFLFLLFCLLSAQPSFGVNAAAKEVILATSSQSPVSLHFKSTSIRDVLTTLAELKQLNLLMAEDVKGEVSVSLDKVDWQQALRLILELEGLSYAQYDNILLVAPAKDITKRRLDKLKASRSLQAAEPLLSVTLSINYAKAKTLADTLKASDNSILTERGQVTVDERTNTLIIKDTANALAEIQQLVAHLDVPAKQVLIEARMVTVRDNVDEQLGIRWGLSSHSSDRKNIFAGSTPSAIQIGSNSGDLALTDRFNVNLPVNNPAGRFALQVAKLADGTLLDLELSALERESKGEIVATPRVLATSQNTSRIEQGTEIPYLQAAAHGATSVAFKKAVLSLEVTPQITPNNDIILELHITQDSRGESVLTSTGPAVAIDTQQIKTRVSVKNGETIVLGGIYQEQLIKAVTKVPLLGDIPYLGELFKSESNYNEKRELLVFVTPKLLP